MSETAEGGAMELLIARASGEVVDRGMLTIRQFAQNVLDGEIVPEGHERALTLLPPPEYHTDLSTNRRIAEAALDGIRSNFETTDNKEGKREDSLGTDLEGYPAAIVFWSADVPGRNPDGPRVTVQVKETHIPDGPEGESYPEDRLGVTASIIGPTAEQPKPDRVIRSRSAGPTRRQGFIGIRRRRDR